MSITTGAKLGRYEIRSKIGEGGMGEVYLAQDTKLGRKVAVKILPRDLTSNPERRRRFELEAQAASALNHPNIITIHEIGTSDNTDFIISEFIEGQTLRRKLERERVDMAQALDIATQIASALDVAHTHGITHRDIKPENIMVRADGLVKILDFGLAKLTEVSISEPAEPEDSTRILVQTTPGIVMGTLNYMSPEQARGKIVDARTDIFSFGVLLHEMLVGESPFAGETSSDVIASILKSEPAPPSSSNDRIPAQLDRIVGKALKKNRDERYQTAAELLRDLRQLQKRLQFDADVERAFGITPTYLKREPIPVQHPSNSSQSAIESLAVLPFTNEGGDPEIEYLSDGLTENILFGLSRMSNIQVVARSAVFRHKGSRDDPLTIGRTLSVPAVVTGSIRQRGTTLLITAELIDVRSGRQLWGAQYKRSCDSLFDLEEEIANEISEKLRLKLLPEKQKVLDRRRTENAEAYHLYLKARFYWGKRTEESLKKSLQLFRQAIEADPIYALAYAGLAEGYIPLAVYCHLSPQESVPKARAAAERAIEIQPELPEALAVLGSIQVHYEWNFRAGEELLRKAVNADPKYPRARQSLAECLTITGRFSESIAEVKKALDLDPLSMHINAAIVENNYFARRYDEAINHGQQAIELDPSFFPTRYYLGMAYQARGDHSQAIAELRRARALTENSTLMTATLAAALGAAGKHDEANALLIELEAIRETRYVPQTPVAAAYVALEDIDEALSRLERAHNDRCVWLIYAVSCDPRFDRVRQERRFQNLVKRVVREF